MARRGLNRAVLVQRGADARQPARQRERNELVDDDGTHHFPRSEGGVDRHGAADHVAATDLLDTPAVPPGEGVAHEIAVVTRKVGRGYLGIDGADQLLTSGAEDLDHAQVVHALPLLHELAQLHQRLLPQQPPGGDALGDAAAVMERAVGGRLVVAVRHLTALLEGPVDLDAEPLVDRLRDEERGDEEQTRGRDEGDQEDRRHELEVEVGSEDAAAPLADQLPEVAGHQEPEQQDQDDRDSVQEQEQAAVGDALREPRQRLLQQQGGDHRQHHDRDPELP